MAAAASAEAAAHIIYTFKTSSARQDKTNCMFLISFCALANETNFSVLW
jgi:hypothetical protein